MNELGYSTETTEPATPAVDAGDTSEFDEADLAGEYDGDLDAIIAAKDKFPTRQESFNATWGDNPEWLDEADLDDEDDSYPDAIIAAGDQDPTRQQSFNATWGDSPEWPDEADLDDEDDSDLDSVTLDENGPAPPDDQGAPPEPALAPEETAGTGTRATDNLGEDATSTADPQPDQPGSGSATAEPDLAPETDATPDEGTDTQPVEPDLPEPAEEATGESLSPEAERLQALEAELDEARRKIAELQAESGKQVTHSEDAGQQLANADRDPGDAITPGDGADAPGTSPDQDAPSPSIADRKDTEQGTDTKTADAGKHPRLRRAFSSGSFGTAAAAFDALDTVAKFAVHASPGEIAMPLAGTLFGLGALALDKFEKNRKGKP